MSTRKPSSRSREVRPAAEALEGRQLLSTTRMISGTDVDGDRWTLKLNGPGVLDVRDKNGNAPTGTTPFTIDTITLASTDSNQTHLIGKVTKAAGGDGRVFFRSMLETGGRGRLPLDPARQAGLEPIANGVHVIDMPNFWLGNTDLAGEPLRPLNPGTPVSTLATSPPVVAGIDIPEGVNTLRFGGVDATFNGNAANNLNSRLEVNLGLPQTQGTSIIIDRSISSAQPAVSATGSPTQDSVYFNVEGRINLFQANSIEGNTANAPSQFNGGSTTGSQPGGTVVTSGTGRAPFNEQEAGGGTLSGAITGQIGDIRVGGNATNLSVVTFDNTGSGSTDQAKVSNFSIGGETNNVLLIAPGGSRNVFFGKGMDTVTINSLYIAHLQANRGALNSDVTVRRNIDSATFGGDVINTNVLAGYDQDFGTMVQGVRLQGTAPETITNQAPRGGRFAFSPPFVPLAQNGGRIVTRVAGNVIGSVFAASVNPNPPHDKSDAAGEFGGSNINLPSGIIKAKVEGTIDNSANTLVAPSAATRAFFASNVQLGKGAVTPPSAAEAPYAPTTQVAPHSERQVAKHLQPNGYARAKVATVTPKGPVGKKK